MTLPVPQWVYGTLRDVDGQVQASATIKASGSTGASADSYASTTTDANGKYVLNLQNYASYGDTIKVIATYEEYEITDTYTLTLGDLPKLVNLQFESEPEEGVSNLFRIYHRPNQFFKIVPVHGHVVKFG